MSQPLPRALSQDSTDGIRKRVGKACDRCRLKKSKCDGAHPCSRCKTDNAICVFGERKKSSDKVYPKGYVEMLEQQQSQLVSGLQEMYKRLNLANAWKTETLSETNGHPLTHDILAALDLLEIKPDGSGDMELFEEDCQRLQSRLLSEGAKLVHRRGSFSSDSDHSQPPHHSRSVSNSTPSLIHTTSFFPDNYSFGSTASSPTIQSPVQMNPTHRSSLPFAVQPPSATLLQNQHHFLNQTPHPHSPLSNDPQLYQAEWCLPNMSTHNQVIRAKHGHSTDGVMALHQHPQQHSRSFRPHLGLQLHQSHHDHRPRLSHPHQVHSPSVPSPATAAMYDMPLQQQQQQQQQLLLQSQQQALFGSTEFEPNLPMDFVDTFVDSPMAGLRPGLVQNSAVDGFDSMEMEYNRYVEVMT